MLDRHPHLLLPRRQFRSIKHPRLNTEQFVRIETAALNFLEPRVFEDLGGRDPGLGIGVEDSVQETTLLWKETFKGIKMWSGDVSFSLGRRGGFGDG